MATISLTTTGLRDVIPTRTPPIQLFTIGYLLFGATAAVYTLSTITAFIVEGDLTEGFRRRRMQATIDGMQGHFVVCGAGQTGSAVLRELVNTQRACVAIEHNHQHIAGLEREHPAVSVLHGDHGARGVAAPAGGCRRRRGAGADRRHAARGSS